MTCGHPPPSAALSPGSTHQWLHSTALFRIYHQDSYTSTGNTRRTFGPLERFDAHEDLGVPAFSPTLRSVLYLAEDIATCALEIFCDQDGTVGEALICPQWKAAIIYPDGSPELQELRG